MKIETRGRFICLSRVVSVQAILYNNRSVTDDERNQTIVLLTIFINITGNCSLRYLLAFLALQKNALTLCSNELHATFQQFIAVNMLQTYRLLVSSSD